MNQNINEIWAKKPTEKNRERATLKGHTKDVINSFQYLFGTKDQSTRLGKRWLSFFKLDYVNDREPFWLNTHTACALHDIGKANSGFQNAILGKGEQVVRHEHLSGAVLFLPQVRERLQSIQGLDYDILLCAVIGHHLKAYRESFLHKQSANISNFLIYPVEIEHLLEQVFPEEKQVLSLLESIPKLWELKPDTPGFNLMVFREEIISYLKNIQHEIGKDDKRKQMLWAVRAALIAADSAGSGLPREEKDLKDWISNAFSNADEINGEFIEDHVIEPRFKDIKITKPFPWNPMQEDVVHLNERVLLISSCGSGKTLAAWRWIQTQAEKKPVSRVIFLYPTRATATEGFRDYVSWAPEASLLHGTSAYELQDMFKNPDDIKSKKDFTVEDRLFAIGYWEKRIFSATVDQFLGFMQYSYRSVCLLPLLVDSIIVFDEVHSFDKSLFSALKKFLQEFDVPVMCMTASLHANRIKELQETGNLKLYQPPDDKNDAAKIERYHVQTSQTKETMMDLVGQILQSSEKKKILWVVNTVSRCQEIAKQYEQSICYHSRFTLDDRKKRHNQLITNFKDSEGPLLCITTQVCEMSLDLDADILITEEAPITSLIQRMGRCNRHKPENKPPGDVFIYKPAGEMPYEKDDWKGVEPFIKEVNGRKSQEDLNELLKAYGANEPEADKYAAFTESGPWAQSREASLRDESDFTVPAILDRDIETFVEQIKQHKPTDGLMINVPKKKTKKHDDARLPGWLLIALESHYNSQLGFLDQPKGGE